jgi:hypothetical protein
MKRSHLISQKIILVLAVVLAAFFVLGTDNPEAQAVAQAGVELEQIPVSPQLANYLEKEFCQDGLCQVGNWQGWIILAPDSMWSVEELAQVRETLLTTIQALDAAGFDGQALLSGYRFRRHHAEYIDDVPGRIARIYHETGEIALADTAFIRLWGWYPYHELGHVIDRRLDSEPRARFHALAGSKAIPGSEETADGFWMNEHARFDHGESAADAIALWIVMRYTDNPKPVFWLIPNDTDYEMIAATMEQVLVEIAGR